jgi:hypothetical protein
VYYFFSINLKANPALQGYRLIPTYIICSQGIQNNEILVSQIPSSAATLALLDLLAPEWKALSSCRSSSGLGLHSCLDLACHSEKSLLNVGGCLGRSFEKLDSKAIRKFFSLFGGHDTLSCQIGFVSYQKFVDILSSISINLMQPLFYIVERFLVSDVVNNNNTMRTAIVRRRNGAETFLSRCIPNLKFDGLAV